MAQEKTVFKKSIEGASWVTLSMIGQRLVNVVALVTLARILTPEIYGIMIGTNIVVGGLNVITNPGFGTLAIQEKKNLDRFLNPAWTFELLKGITLFLIVALAAPLITKLFHIQGNEAVVVFGATYLILTGLKNTGSLYLMRDMEFGKIFIQNMAEAIAYLAVALTWALIDPSVWALAAGAFASYLAVTICTYALHPYRPKLDFHIGRFLKLYKKTKWIIGTNFLQYLNGILDNTVLGVLLGPANMAFYSKSKDIATMPGSYLSQLTNKVGFSALAKVQDDKEKLRDGFLKMLDLNLLISTPFVLVLLFEAHRLVPLLLGPQWIEMVPSLRLLALALSINALVHIVTPILKGVGKFNLRFHAVLIQLISSAILLFIFVPLFGLIGAAYAVIISFALVLLYSLIRLVPLIKLKLQSALPSLLVVLTSAALPIALTAPFYDKLQSIHGALYLVILTLLGALYLLFVLLIGHLTKQGPYKTLRQVFKVLK